MSVQINGWPDLQRYGINALTGEACAYSMRLLCDLSDKGVDHVREYFGLQLTLKPCAQFAANWNSAVDGRPAIASIMLPRGILRDLGTFLLFSVDKIDFIVDLPGGGLAGYTSADMAKYGKTADEVAALYDGKLYRNPRSTEAVGSRNQHAFTGRTV